MTMKNETNHKITRFTEEQLRKMTPGERRKKGIFGSTPYEARGTYDSEKNPRQYEYTIGRDC